MVIISKTEKELSYAYKCSPRTIQRRCEAIGIITRKFLTSKQILLFYSTYGLADIYEDSDTLQELYFRIKRVC